MLYVVDFAVGWVHWWLMLSCLCTCIISQDTHKFITSAEGGGHIHLPSTTSHFSCSLLEKSSRWKVFIQVLIEILYSCYRSESKSVVWNLENFSSKEPFIFLFNEIISDGYNKMLYYCVSNMPKYQIGISFYVLTQFLLVGTGNKEHVDYLPVPATNHH